MKKEAKPFVHWMGGKRRLIPQIERYFPKWMTDGEEGVYVEPFVGGGAMLFHILSEYPNIKKAYIGDANKSLMQTYKVIQERPSELICALRWISDEFSTLHTDEERARYYYLIRSIFILNDPIPPTSYAAMFIFLTRHSFNGLYRVNNHGEFNASFNKTKQHANTFDEESVYACHRALKRVEIYVGCDFEDMFRKMPTELSGNVFVYLDPPYKPLENVAKTRFYTSVEFGDNEQVRLKLFADKLSNRGFHIMESNSTAKVNGKYYFKSLYGNNYRYHFIHANRLMSSKAQTRGVIKELLITNF